MRQEGTAKELTCLKFATGGRKKNNVAKVLNCKSVLINIWVGISSVSVSLKKYLGRPFNLMWSQVGGPDEWQDH